MSPRICFFCQHKETTMFVKQKLFVFLQSPLLQYNVLTWWLIVLRPLKLLVIVSERLLSWFNTEKVKSSFRNETYMSLNIFLNPHCFPNPKPKCYLKLGLRCLTTTLSTYMWYKNALYHSTFTEKTTTLTEQIKWRKSSKISIRKYTFLWGRDFSRKVYFHMWSFSNLQCSIESIHIIPK